LASRKPPVGSAEWWLPKLVGSLRARSKVMQTWDAYYSGHPPLPFLTKAHDSKMRDEFRRLLEESRTNFMALVVDTVEERLKVDGFRLSSSSDPTSDKASWDIWQRNGLDSDSQTAMVESMVKGVSYLSVWPGDGGATIAVEDPLETIVAYEAGSGYRRRAAALKLWRDDWSGDMRANVHLPEGIYKFSAKVGEFDDVASTRWKPLPGNDHFAPNPLKVVSIVPLRNRPRLLHEGQSELDGVHRTQNQINGLLFLLALAGYFGAHKQRWATGLTIMEDEKTGAPVEPFDVDVGKLWVAEGENVKFGEFTQTDLNGYIKAIEQKVLHIAVTTRTPRHYLIESGQSPSGDAIKSAESGLTFKVERKMRAFGEGFEEAIRLARRFEGEEDSPVDSEIVWADPATRTEAERTDAAIKRFQAGLTPWEQTMEDLGYTQTQIARMSAQRASDQLLAGLVPPPPPADEEPETAEPEVA
jgi:hypothetical protein